MPVNDFQDIFERIVLTQGAISARKEMDKWFKQKGRGENVDPDRGSTRAEIADNLFETFKKYHSTIFQYASQYNKRRERKEDTDGIKRVFQVAQLQPEDLASLKQIFTGFVEKYYDDNGQRKAGINPAEAMQELYETLKKANDPGASHFVRLRYLRFPASLIITELGSSEKWKDISPNGINFNRGNKPKPNEDLAGRFQAAFNGDLDAEYERKFHEENQTSPYIHHQESFVEIAGHRFPCLKFGHHTHLISDNGYPVDMTHAVRDRIAQQIASGVSADKLAVPLALEQNPHGEAKKHLSELIRFVEVEAGSSDKVKKWAKSVNDILAEVKGRLQRMQQSNRIDGREVKAGEVMLVSMDIDLLTGLSMVGGAKSDMARLGAFVREHADALRPGVAADLVGMSDFLPLFPNVGESLGSLRTIAENEKNSAIVSLIDTASPHLKAIAPRITEIANQQFEGKKTAQQLGQDPHFYMTIGGVAAGKSNGEKIAAEECGGKNNFVIAELDGIRSKFDRQAINLATDNHNFDYANIAQAGKLVRAQVLERGREQGYNVVLDGSGIPYEGRYAPVLAVFKKKAYGTSVIGVDRTLYVHDPETRKKLDREFPRKAPVDALSQQGGRYGDSLRAVPVKMIANNYAAVPEALLQASRDPNVDRFWLIDTNPKKGREDTAANMLSFTIEVTGEQLDKLDELKGAELKAAIVNLGNDKVSAIMNHTKYSPDALPAEGWNFKAVAKIGNNYRIEVMTDAKRYLGTLEKGLFNTEANGPEELYKITRSMNWDVEALFQNDRHALNVQPDEHISINNRPEIPCATRYSLAALQVKNTQGEVHRH